MIGLHRYIFSLFVIAALTLLLINTKEAFSDNLSLTNCTDRFFRGDFSISCRSYQSISSEGHDTLQDSIDTMALWISEDFQQLARRCVGDSLCGCFSVNAQKYDPVLYDQINAYYAAISHKIVYGKFPVLDACMEQFVSSSFLAYKTQSYQSLGNSDLEWIHRELAFLINRGWRDMRQRGTIAYWQGIKYFGDGLFEEAEQAFLIASEIFAETTVPGLTSSHARSLALLGKARFSKNNLDGAVEAYYQSILTYPKEAAQGRVDAFFELVVAWLAQGYDAGWMIKQFGQLRTFNQTDPYLSSGAATAFIKAGMLDEAQYIMDSAPTITRQSASWLGAYGLLAESRDDIEAARHFYQEAIYLAKDHEPAAAEQWIARLNALPSE